MTMEQDNKNKNALANGAAGLPTSLGRSYKNQSSRSRTLAGATLRQTFGSGRDCFANEVRSGSLLAPRFSFPKPGTSHLLAVIDHHELTSIKGMQARACIAECDEHCTTYA